MMTKTLTHPHKVLLIEDNMISQKVIRLLLNELGFEVDITSTGAEGLQAIQQRDYAAIFIDMGLPDMSGLQVVSFIRSRSDDKRNLLAIAMTADGLLLDEENFHQKMLDAFLLKPITLSQLQEALIPFFHFNKKN